jgi:hypothetical protein
MPDKIRAKADFGFHKDGFFYDMIGSYGAAVCGLMFYEPQYFKPIIDFREQTDQDLAANFRSVVLGKNIMLKPITTYLHLQNNLITLTTIRHNLIYMLINICYESVKDKLDRNLPHHEFFRHLRNASSHGGKYFFHTNQPNKKAEWKGIEIINSFNGQSIWSIGIDEADIFLLLTEIDNDLITSTGRVIQPEVTLLD